MASQLIYAQHVDRNIQGRTIDLAEAMSRKAKAPADHQSILQTRVDRLNAEISQLQAARTDILGKMSASERSAYDATQGVVVKTEEQLKAEIAEAARLMNENKDRPSH